MGELRTAREVWEHLVAEGGLEPDSWDAPFAEALRDRLGLDPSGELGDQLDAAGVGVEQLVYAVFGQLEPYGQMMADLLALFERHNVKHTDAIAEIEFDFDAPGQPLSFDLDAFRTARTEWVSALVSVPVVDWTGRAYWDLQRALTGSDYNPPMPESEAVVEWDARYQEGEWAQLAAPEPTGIADLDAELDRAWAVWTGILAASMAAAPNRDALSELWNAATSNEGGPEPRIHLLGLLNSDLWPASTAQRLFTVYEQIAAAPAGERERAAEEIGRRLRDFFLAHPLTYELQRGLVERLLDVLELPVWKRRHELYAAWVLAELVAAIRREVRLCPHKGVLSFPFRATRMARVVGCEPPLEIWSELRTPLSDPQGVTRSASVQPDYSVTAACDEDATPRSHTSHLEVEVKQYKKASNRAFGHALRDYAKARPSALVTLVSHGRVNEATVHGHVEAEFRGRTRVVGELHPGHQPARDLFRDLVWRQLEPVCPEPPAPAGAAAVCTLDWEGPPRDLDLHLYVDWGSGRDRVYHDRTGLADRHPYAWLAEDMLHPGSERIAIERWLDARYELAVRNYSGEAPLAGCGAKVTVVAGGEATELRCPAEGDGRWWLVGRIDGRGRRFEAENVIASEQPAWARRA